MQIDLICPEHTEAVTDKNKLLRSTEVQRPKGVYEPSWLEVDLDKLSRNIKKVKDTVGRNTKIMFIVKGDGIGCGGEMISKIAIENGVHSLAVARVFEGVDLRNHNINVPILNLGYFTDDEIESILKYDISQTIFRLDLAKHLNEAARLENKKIKVHIKIDTGMGRLGIRYDEFSHFLEEFIDLKNLSLEGVFTHFSSASEADGDFTHQQVERFKGVVSLLREKGINPPFLHTANSAAILYYPDFYFNMVRPGIILYGSYPNNSIDRILDVEQILSLKTVVSHIKRVPANCPISYDRTYYTDKESTIITLPIGYTDGLNRLLSNKGEVLLKGRRFPIAGRVSMDQVIINAGDFCDVKIGDVVVIYGRDGGDEITITEIARKINSIEHEVQTHIGVRVPRVYIRNNEVIAIKRYELL